jgi:hypothetical protein
MASFIFKTLDRWIFHLSQLKCTITVKVTESRLLLLLARSSKAVFRRNTADFLVSMTKIAEDTQE